MDNPETNRGPENTGESDEAAKLSEELSRIHPVLNSGELHDYLRVDEAKWSSDNAVNSGVNEAAYNWLHNGLNSSPEGVPMSGNELDTSRLEAPSPDELHASVEQAIGELMQPDASGKPLIERPVDLRAALYGPKEVGERDHRALTAQEITGYLQHVKFDRADAAQDEPGDRALTESEQRAVNITKAGYDLVAGMVVARQREGTPNHALNPEDRIGDSLSMYLEDSSVIQGHEQTFLQVTSEGVGDLAEMVAQPDVARDVIRTGVAEGLIDRSSTEVDPDEMAAEAREKIFGDDEEKVDDSLSDVMANAAEVDTAIDQARLDADRGEENEEDLNALALYARNWKVARRTVNSGVGDFGQFMRDINTRYQAEAAQYTEAARRANQSFATLPDDVQRRQNHFQQAYRAFDPDGRRPTSFFSILKSRASGGSNSGQRAA